MIAAHPRLFRLLVFLLVLLACACAWLLPLHAQSTPPDPHIRAYLDSPGRSTVTWSSDRRLCLSYAGAFDSCYSAGRNTVTFGHVGSLDGTLRPYLHGVYVLSDPTTGASWRAELRRRALYLAVIRR